MPSDIANSMMNKSKGRRSGFNKRALERRAKSKGMKIGLADKPTSGGTKIGTTDMTTLREALQRRVKAGTTPSSTALGSTNPVRTTTPPNINLPSGGATSGATKPTPWQSTIGDKARLLSAARNTASSRKIM